MEIFTIFIIILAVLLFLIMYRFGTDLIERDKWMDKEEAYYEKLDICIAKWNRGEK